MPTSKARKSAASRSFSKSAWRKKFEAMVRTSPKIKDPAYVEWLAALTYICQRDKIPVSAFAQDMGAHRTHIHALLRGVYIAKHDNMEHAAAALDMTLLQLRQMGRELLGGEQEIQRILQQVEVWQRVAGVHQHGGLMFTQKYDGEFISRDHFATWWGLYAKIAIFESEQGRFLVSCDRSAMRSRRRERGQVLVMGANGRLTVVPFKKAGDRKIYAVVVHNMPQAPKPEHELPTD